MPVLLVLCIDIEVVENAAGYDVSVERNFFFFFGKHKPMPIYNGTASYEMNWRDCCGRKRNWWNLSLDHKNSLDFVIRDEC